MSAQNEIKQLRTWLLIGGLLNTVGPLVAGLTLFIWLKHPQGFVVFANAIGFKVFSLVVVVLWLGNTPAHIKRLRRMGQLQKGLSGSGQ